MDDAQPIYQETDSWPALSWAVLLGVSVALLYGALNGQLAGDPGGWDLETAFGIALAVLLPLGFYLTVGSLTIAVFSDRIEIRFGRLGLIRKSVDLNRVASVEPVTYRPLREFGGWGIRTRPGRRAWTVRGNQAVRLTLTEPPEIYLGTRYPQRLQERIDLARTRLEGSVDAPADNPEGS
jgi:hypothetical protein